jgi:hypothetical protein
MLAALTVPPLVVSIGQRYERSTRGVVAFKMHRVFDVHAGPSSRHDDLVLDGVYRDGTLVNVHILSDTIGGKPQSADRIAAAEQQWVHPKPGDVFHAPFDPRYSAEYRYGPCAGTTVSFTPLIHDAAHGAGAFTLDARENVVAYTYTPSDMPQYATAGTVRGTRKNVLSGYWATTQEIAQYSGRYALWKGGATVEYTMSEFRRYPSLSAAVAAIHGER